MEKESNETANQAEGRVAISAKSSGPLRFVEFALRALALGATLAAAIVMGKNKQTLSVLAVAKYSYSPAFVFFVIANAIACGYAFFSVPISLLRPHSFAATKFLIFFLDLVMVALVTAGASAATAIAYVGHKGNSHTLWSPICGLFGRFCNHVGGALVSSFIGVIIFMVLTVISTLSLYKHRR